MYTRVILASILMTLVNCGEQPIYVVSALKQARPLSTYTVLVSLHNSNTSLNIRATLSGSVGENATGEVTVESGQSQEITLEIGDWRKVDNLLVEGSGAVTFSKEQPITFNSKKNSIFIQTDRAIYQPGHIVKFRVFVIDDQLKPYHSDIAVLITDPQRNRIKQYVDVTLEKGVFSGELQLSDKPLLGNWEIKAIVEGAEKTKQVSVEEYVLPSYEVTVTPPPFATFSEATVPIRVEAKYTFGKPVQGTVILNATVECRYTWPRKCFEKFTKVTTLDKRGQAIITLEVPDILSKHDKHPKTFKLQALITEDLTNKTMNVSASFTVYPHAEKLELSSSPHKFRPGLPIQITAILSDQDNKPLIMPDAPVAFEISYEPLDISSTNMQLNVPSNGIIQFDFTPPKYAPVLRITAKFKAVTAHISIGEARAESGKHILVVLKTKKTVKVGGQAKFRVRASFQFNHLTYEVVSGGDIFDGTTLHFPMTRSHEFSVNITQNMTPRSRLIIYTISDDGYVISGSIDYQVDGFFLTPVKVSANPTETEPGSLVSVEVNTNPSAMVYLLGVDQRVLLLESGNDLNKEEIEKDFAGYGASNTPSHRNGPPNRWYMWRPPIGSSQQVFENAGLILYTNANNYEEHISHEVYWRSQPRFYPNGRSGNSAYHMSPRISGVYHNPPAPSPTPQPQLPKVRKVFPETWIWETTTARNNSKAILNATVPDTITSWIISAIAIDEDTGLGLSDSTAKVTVFRSFFISLNLPYSVVRGETLKLQALIFNYMQEDVEANITLFNENDDFDFVEHPIDARSQTTNFTIPAGGTVSAIFPIIFKTLGYNKIKISAIATSPNIAAGDAIQKELLVKAEGTTKYFNKPFFVDLRKQKGFSTELNIELPDDMVLDSEHVEISVIGDVMGPTINNIDKLLRVPYGCGEQNMINFVPNIVVANYLEEIGQLTEERRQKAVHNMLTGYQRELNYKHQDGSFSAFGASDSHGSTWLTAYVLKSFAQAKPFITISDSIFQDGLQFLSKLQLADGKFAENGRLLQKSMQGGVGNTGLSMTAYIAIAFLEIGNPEYNSTVSKALEALEKRLPNATDPYDIALTTYALHKGDSPLKDYAFYKLNSIATKEGGNIYWKKDKTVHTYETHSISSLNVEATGYSLMTYVLRNMTAEAIPIFRWMVGQRSENGGFASTQDTVIGLEALSKLAGQVVMKPNHQVDVTFNSGTRAKKFSVTKDNSLVLQQDKLPSDTQLVEITAKGNGVCIAQVTWSYNVMTLALSGTFAITAKVDSKTGDSYQLTVCASYTDKDGKASNMAIIQLNSLSGYSFDKQDQPRGAKRVEYDLGNTRINLYYDEIDENETCVTGVAIVNNEVGNLKEADVVVYDYYQLDKKAIFRYKI